MSRTPCSLSADAGLAMLTRVWQGNFVCPATDRSVVASASFSGVGCLLNDLFGFQLVNDRIHTLVDGHG